MCMLYHCAVLGSVSYGRDYYHWSLSLSFLGPFSLFLSLSVPLALYIFLISPRRTVQRDVATLVAVHWLNEWSRVCLF